jgi:TatA/E family protein of Tat protein translocase
MPVMPWLAFFNLDGFELVVILVVAILLFGDSLPQVARSVARSFLEFKKGLQDLRSKSGIDEEIRNLKREVELGEALPNPRRLIQSAIRDAETAMNEPAGNGADSSAHAEVPATPPKDAYHVPPPEPSPFERDVSQGAPPPERQEPPATP